MTGIRVPRGQELGYGTQGMFTSRMKKKTQEDKKMNTEETIIERPDIKNTGKISIKSTRQISSDICNIPTIDDIYEKISGNLQTMELEDTKWLNYAESVKYLMNNTYIQNLQDMGALISLDIVCSALNSRLTDGSTTYTRDVIAEATFEHPINTYKIDSTGTINEGIINGPGRMNGNEGWSADKNMIAGALASYTHNFVALLMAFFKRAKLPLKNSIKLPNLVLSETVSPSQFIPPLSMSYHILPSPIMKNIIKVSTPTPASIHPVIWDSNKKEIARTSPIAINIGTTEITIQTLLNPLQNKGFLNIEVDKAPQGIIIESISSFPPVF